MSREAHTRSGVLRQHTKAFAAILTENGWITENDLATADQHAAREHLDLVEALVALRLVDEHDSYAALSIAAGVDFIDLERTQSSPLAIRLVAASLALRHLVVPIDVDNRVLTFATCKPFNPAVERELRLAAGRQTRMLVARRSVVLAALPRCYPHLRGADVLTSEAGRHAVDGWGVPHVAHAATAESGMLVGTNCLAMGTSKGRSRRRVLVTDDEPITRVVITRLLQRVQFDVFEAVNGREAIALAHRERPDLVLMDLNMPVMTGYEAIDEIRRDVSLATLPILVLTSEHGPQIERRVLQLGADDYVIKPFDPEALVSRVIAAVHRARGAAATAAGVQGTL